MPRSKQRVAQKLAEEYATPKELAQQKAIMKVYRKYQQREYERVEHPAQFPSDYFFSALAELVLDDWKFVVSVI